MPKTHQGSCHCGFVQFEIDSDLETVGQCDCSICTMRGAIYQRVEVENFRLLKPAASSLIDNTHGLLVYQFNTRIAIDYICPVCGIETFKRPRSAPELWAINVRCLSGIKVEDLKISKNYGSRFSVVDGSMTRELNAK